VIYLQRSAPQVVLMDSLIVAAAYKSKRLSVEILQGDERGEE